MRKYQFLKFTAQHCSTTAINNTAAIQIYLNSSRGGHEINSTTAIQITISRVGGNASRRRRGAAGVFVSDFGGEDRVSRRRSATDVRIEERRREDKNWTSTRRRKTDEEDDSDRINKARITAHRLLGRGTFDYKRRRQFLVRYLNIRLHKRKTTDKYERAWFRS
ncbi:sister chromatid cohesion protein pds5-like protein b [Striga asiatica]|uniref:Sister chromatid cohesion protein pds5-like protein b n=1 Tax=Striga asiatica TaxID=4170 RepID=A0A5A7PF43_STRAF|nr:sister chromatid cohesion protein pds5-like protein b [Striga asiatica]